MNEDRIQREESLMTPNEYQLLAARTDCDRTANVLERIAESNPDGATLLHGVIGLPGEVGELSGALEKWIFYKRELDKVNVVEEAGDCLWYIAQILRAVGCTLEDAMERNIAKLQKRFPEKFDYDLAKEENRDRGAEREILSKATDPVVERRPPGVSYTQSCIGEGCANFVHKTNQLKLCGDCAADTRAGRRTPAGKLVTNPNAQDDGVSYDGR